MAAANLARHLAARHVPFLLAVAALLAAFQYLICAAVSSVNVSGALQSLVASLPPFVQGLVSSQLLGGFSERGLIAFGWNHPVAHVLGAAPAIVLAAAAIAGEIESGSIELVLSQPLSRAAWFGVQAAFAAAALALVTAAGILGTALGQAVFGMRPFGPVALARLAANFAALQAAGFGITLLLSSFGREGGRVASLGFLIVVASYFAQAIGRLWSRAAWVLPWTLHDHFAPQKILVDGAGVGRPVALLLSVAVVALAIAWARFRSRDLP